MTPQGRPLDAVMLNGPRANSGDKSAVRSLTTLR